MVMANRVADIFKSYLSHYIYVVQRSFRLFMQFERSFITPCVICRRFVSIHPYHGTHWWNSVKKRSLLFRPPKPWNYHGQPMSRLVRNWSPWPGLPAPANRSFNFTKAPKLWLRAWGPFKGKTYRTFNTGVWPIRGLSDWATPLTRRRFRYLIVLRLARNLVILCETVSKNDSWRISLLPVCNVRLGGLTLEILVIFAIFAKLGSIGVLNLRYWWPLLATVGTQVAQSPQCAC